MSMNAANNIEAKSRNLMELLFKKKYQVKYFQREYRWQRNNIEDLLVDLERSFMANYNVEHTRDDVPDYNCYYMGPVVLYREKTTHVIVDGQQRLTSFTLLLIYLIHLQKMMFQLQPKRIQNLAEYIFSQPFERESFNLEIEERESILKCLYEDSEIQDRYIENESSRNIYERYADIEDLFPIKLKREEILPLFINWLTEKLIFIEIMAHSSENAYTIFESMNDRGLKLTQTELLKSYLLSNVLDESKIKELDVSWKKKVALFKSYSLDEDEQFFKVWLRAKYAVTIRTSDKTTAQDFEKIGTRFSNWVQDSAKRLLGLKNSEAFFYFVDYDFHFYSDIYLKISDLETNEGGFEHNIKLISYKGISNSLSYPLIISPITKVDDETTIDSKIDITVSYIDSFSIYRLLLGLPITQSSIDYSINKLIVEIRDMEIESLKTIFREDILKYKTSFLQDVGYIKFETNISKYLLSRLYRKNFLDIPFETIFFQRKKDSFVLYQFLTHNDVEPDVHKIPRGLKDIFIESLCSYAIVPRQIVPDLDKMKIHEKIKFLIRKGFIGEFETNYEIDMEKLKDFFILRNKIMKEKIMNFWKI